MKRIITLIIVLLALCSGNTNIYGQSLLSPYRYAVSSSYDSDYQAYLDRLTALAITHPTNAVKTAQNQFVLNLKNAGLWTRLKTCYFFHSGSAQTGTVNLKNPLTYQSTIVNALDFLEGTGTKSNGFNSYINQPFKSDEYAGIQSDLTVIQYVATTGTATGSECSSGMRTGVGPANYNALRPSTDGVTGTILTHTSAGYTFSSTTNKGLYIYRNTSTAAVMYKDGVKTSSVATPTAPNESNNRFILALNNGSAIQWYQDYVSIDLLFDGFVDADAATFKTSVWDPYKTSVGLP